MSTYGQDYMSLNVLKSLKLWLDPLDEKKKATSLPNKTLITKVPSPRPSTPSPVKPAMTPLAR